MPGLKAYKPFDEPAFLEGLEAAGCLQRLDTSEERITARYQHALSKMQFAVYSERFASYTGIRKVHGSTVQFFNETPVSDPFVHIMCNELPPSRQALITPPGLPTGGFTPIRSPDEADGTIHFTFSVQGFWPVTVVYDMNPQDLAAEDNYAPADLSDEDEGYVSSASRRRALRSSTTAPRSSTARYSQSDSGRYDSSGFGYPRSQGYGAGRSRRGSMAAYESDSDADAAAGAGSSYNQRRSSYYDSGAGLGSTYNSASTATGSGRRAGRSSSAYGASGSAYRRSSRAGSAAAFDSSYDDESSASESDAGYGRASASASGAGTGYGRRGSTAGSAYGSSSYAAGGNGRSTRSRAASFTDY